MLVDKKDSVGALDAATNPLRKSPKFISGRVTPQLWMINEFAIFNSSPVSSSKTLLAYSCCNRFGMYLFGFSSMIACASLFISSVCNLGERLFPMSAIAFAY
jgi:hypothetical protein